MSADVYLGKLRAFYDQAKIAATAGFECANKVNCEKAATGVGRNLTHGAEAHVGTRYGEKTRIVVVSLDAAGGTFDLAGRQTDIEQVAGRDRRDINPHMRGTIDLLRVLLGQSKDLSPLPFYAMTNAAKCTANDGSHDMVPAKLFEHCRSFALEELRILEPEIIVTQGTQARAVLEKETTQVGPTWTSAVLSPLREVSEVSQWLQSLADEYLRIWRTDRFAAVVLMTPHPSARGGQWQRFARTCLDPLSWLATELASSAS